MNSRMQTNRQVRNNNGPWLKCFLTLQHSSKTDLKLSGLPGLSISVGSRASERLAGISAKHTTSLPSSAG
jgi:hypothetical protein